MQFDKRGYLHIETNFACDFAMLDVCMTCVGIFIMHKGKKIARVCDYTIEMLTSNPEFAVHKHTKYGVTTGWQHLDKFIAFKNARSDIYVDGQQVAHMDRGGFVTDWLKEVIRARKLIKNDLHYYEIEFDSDTLPVFVAMCLLAIAITY